MQAFLDGQEIKLPRPTLAAGLEAAVRAAESSGRIIVEAWLDGRPLASDELESPSDLPGASLRLDLVSAQPRELVAATLLDAAAALEGIESTQREAGRLIQAGSLDQCMDPIKLVVETWSGVQSIIERGSAILSTDLAKLSPIPFEPLASGLTSQLGSLKSGLERQDWSAVSDVLAYELPAQARAWRSVLAGIATALAESAPAGGPRP